MPSPLAHLAAGAALGRAAQRAGGPPAWRVYAAALAFSVLPDVDVLPGLWFGDLSGWHNQASHSVAVGLAACLAGSVALKPWLAGWSWRRTFAFLCACVGAHLLMDWATYGRGLMLLWPFAEARFSAPTWVFYGVRHSEGWRSGHHLATLASEAATVGVAALACWASSRSRSRRRIRG